MNSDPAHVEGGHQDLLKEADSSAVLDTEIHPMIQRSQEAFRRALPELLKHRKLQGQWVGYSGDDRIGIAKAEDDLYEECARRGLNDHEYVVRCIIPEMSGDSEATPSFDV
jgi:hypothetical protein